MASTSGRSRLAAAVAAAAVVSAIVGAGSIAPAQAAPARLVIWADQIRADVLKQEFPDGFRDTKLSIVVKDSLAAIKDELKTVKPADAPDVIAAEHDSTGELVDAKLVRRLTLTKALTALFPTNVLSGFRFNSRVYGIPVQYENLALVTSVKLVPKQPSSFAKVVAVAKRLLKNGKATTGIAVGQGDAGNAYNMYTLFSGLGGYAIGVDQAGNANPSDIGIANPAFLKNAPQIKDWNDARIIEASLTTQGAKEAFLAGKAPFWITGPWDLASITSLPFAYRITTVPTIVKGKATSPLLGMKGFMVTVFAQAHQAKTLADAFVTQGLSRAGVQAAFGNAARRMPANVKAASRVTDPRLRAFGAAGALGVPIPNIPQMQSVWGPLGTAWAASTRGAGASPPVAAFTSAQAAVTAAIAARP
ncbi:MAG: extracellular solute-binding protein [Candidatus Nanopelagicales bacterium]|nr:extracellular solute-binding protein [Candidatus Nanopelagicales bacterium]